MSRSSCAMLTGLLGDHWGTEHRGAEPNASSPAACSPAFIELQVTAGVWAAGDLVGVRGPVVPGMQLDLSQPCGELAAHTTQTSLSPETEGRIS